MGLLEVIGNGKIGRLQEKAVARSRVSRHPNEGVPRGGPGVFFEVGRLHGDEVRFPVTRAQNPPGRDSLGLKGAARRPLPPTPETP